MKEQNSVFLKMIAAVSKYLKANDVLIGMPAIVALLVKLDEKNVKMVTLFDLINLENKALNVSVDLANEKVIAQLFAVIKALEVYFTKNGDPSMIANLHLTRSSLQRASCKAIEASVKSVVKIARDNIAHLAIYNTNEEMLVGIESNTSLLVNATAALTAYQDEKKEQQAEFDVYMEETKELLREIDMVVEIVSLTYPIIYKGYVETRNKKEYAELLFTITVLNSETKKPEENARVVVQSTTRTEKNAPYVLIDRRTGKTGEVRNNKREFDVYKMIIEKVGCQRHTQVFTVADNTPLRLEVFLKKMDVPI